MGITFILKNNNKKVPRAANIITEPWQTDIYNILQEVGIDCVVIEYTRDD